MNEKYLKELEKLMACIKKIDGPDRDLTYENATDRAVEIMNRDHIEIRQGDGIIENDPEWFKIQTADADRNIIGPNTYARIGKQL